MTTVTETVRVSGVRCERCVGRLAGTLQGHDGLEWANANLMGDVTLAWDRIARRGRSCSRRSRGAVSTSACPARLAGRE